MKTGAKSYAVKSRIILLKNIKLGSRALPVAKKNPKKSGGKSHSGKWTLSLLRTDCHSPRAPCPQKTPWELAPTGNAHRLLSNLRRRTLPSTMRLPKKTNFSTRTSSSTKPSSRRTKTLSSSATSRSAKASQPVSPSGSVLRFPILISLSPGASVSCPISVCLFCLFLAMVMEGFCCNGWVSCLLFFFKFWLVSLFLGGV